MKRVITFLSICCFFKSQISLLLGTVCGAPRCWIGSCWVSGSCFRCILCFSRLIYEVDIRIYPENIIVLRKLFKKQAFFPPADFQLETLYKDVVSLFKSAWVIFIEVLNIPVALHIVILHREKHLWIFSCCSSVWELLLCQAL